MSWLTQLSQCYDQMSAMDNINSTDQCLVPIAHSTQNANLEVQLDADGYFLTATVLKNPTKSEIKEARKNNYPLVKEQVTIIPVTEASASRTGTKPPPHPLHDKLMYVAGDYQKYGGPRSGYETYINLLKRWCDFDPGNVVIRAVYRYVSKGSLIRDLLDEGLIAQKDGAVIEKWQQELGPKPPLYSSINGNVLDAFVRFSVVDNSGNVILPWEDIDTINSYIRFDESTQETMGLDYTTGETKALARTHPRNIRFSSDGAKLISSNDTSGFTFRGRFLDSAEACQISYETSQKAHNALKFLIQRQGYTVGDRVFLISGSSGRSFPNPAADTHTFSHAATIMKRSNLSPKESVQVENYHFEKHLANELSAALSGLQHDFSPDSSIFVMILDSPVPGRLSIIYYREFTGPDKDQFFLNVEAWHSSLAWRQSRSKNKGKYMLTFIGAPSLQEIALAAYGIEKSDEQKGSYLDLDKGFDAIVSAQLFPLIIGGFDNLPAVLVRQAYYKACSPQNYSPANWDKVRTTACSLIKAYRNQKYQETWRYTVDMNSSDITYNIGRLLAVMQQIEERAQWISDNKKPRTTNAVRYFTKVMEYPSSAFATLAASLVPYRSTLDKAGDAGVDLYAMEQQISSLIDPQEFAEIRHLDGRFLLGYDAQLFYIFEENKRRQANKKAETETGSESERKTP